LPRQLVNPARVPAQSVYRLSSQAHPLAGSRSRGLSDLDTGQASSNGHGGLHWRATVGRWG
jgi:hypothetical protein